jgi:hypothetical protein
MASEDDMGYADALQEIYDDWTRRMRQQGEERGIEVGIRIGIKVGMRESLAGTYEARFGAMPAKLRAILDVTANPSTLRRWSGLFATASNEEIAADIRASARP